MGKDNHTFQKLLHIGSEVISEDHHSDSRGLWSFSLGPSHSGSLRPPYGYLPSCRIGIDRLGNWQNSHIGSLIYGTRVVIVGKARWKPLEQPLPGEQLKKKKKSNTMLLEGLQRLVSPSRIWRILEWQWFPPTNPFNSLFWHVWKTGRSWRMTVNLCLGI